MKKMKKLDGFTLIELLVVIAIIAILASITFPLLVNAKNSSKLAHCTSNKRQVIQAWFMYSADNDGWIAPTTWGYSDNIAPGFIDGNVTFFHHLSSTNYYKMLKGPNSLAHQYIGLKWQVFKCPSDNFLSPEQRKRGWKYRVRSISSNPNMGVYAGSSLGDLGFLSQSRRDYSYGSGGTAYDTLSQIRFPSKRWAWIDSHPSTVNYPQFDLMSPTIDGWFRQHWFDLPSNLHSGGATLVFADGHTELKKWKGKLRSLPVKYDFYTKREKKFSIGDDDYEDWKWLVERKSQLKVELP